jgi:hypothetical protein
MARIQEQDYAEESRGALTGRQLRSISSEEVQLFNLDYDRLIDQEQSSRARRILETARDYAFELTRHVMQRANQRYGGSTAEGDEIGIRLLRPDDLEMGVAVATGTPDSWQFTWTGTGDQDVFGTGANPIDMGDQSQAESVLIVAWSTNHPSPKTESVQATKFTRDLFVQPLPWDVVAEERGGVKVVEANPWFVAFPGEQFSYDANVFATGDDVVRALGIYVSIGTNLRTM